MVPFLLLSASGLRAAPGVPLDDIAPERAAGIRKAAMVYEKEIKRLIPKDGVRFYMDWTRGKWGWTGMPVAGVLDGKIYLLTLDNVGSFFKPIDSREAAYELATFIPTYWSYTKKSVKRRGKLWVVKVNAVGLNETQKTVLTFEVSREGTCRQTSSSNPGANPTEGIHF